MFGLGSYVLNRTKNGSVHSMVWISDARYRLKIKHFRSDFRHCRIVWQPNHYRWAKIRTRPDFSALLYLFSSLKATQSSTWILEWTLPRTVLWFLRLKVFTLAIKLHSIDHFVTVNVRNLNVWISVLFILDRLSNRFDFEQRLKYQQFRSDFGCSVGWPHRHSVRSIH